MSPAVRCYAVVPCAGVGTRAVQTLPKQYVELAGCTVVGHALAALGKVPRIARTLVVLAPDDTHFERAVPDFDGWLSRRGGARRVDTVHAGVLALQEQGVQPDDWVLVHDAARCLVPPEVVNRLIDACWDDPVGGLLAVPVADTLKRAGWTEDGQVRVAAGVDRQNLWQAQTPQMFRWSVLHRALARVLTGIDPETGDHTEVVADTITDESSAVERMGLQPRLVAATAENFKLTLPADFVWAEQVLRARQASGCTGAAGVQTPTAEVAP